MIMWILIWTLFHNASAAPSEGYSIVGENSLLKWNDGYVCDDYFNKYAAELVCKAMKMKYVSFQRYQPGPSDEYSMDNLYCHSYMTDISQCYYQKTYEDCGINEHVSLVCEEPDTPWPSTSPTLGPTHVPLPAEIDHTQFYSLTSDNILKWKDGYVCDDAFDDRAAELVCESMGAPFHSWGTVVGPGNFRDFSINYLKCYENSESLYDCFASFEHKHWCSYPDHIYLDCTDHGMPVVTPDPHAPVSDHTSGYSLDSQGLLMWKDGYVCKSGFTDATGVLVCQSMGYQFKSWKQHEKTGKEDFTFELSNLFCDYNARDLRDCTVAVNSHGDVMCFRFEAIYLECNGWERQTTETPIEWQAEDHTSGYHVSDLGWLMWNTGYVCSSGFDQNVAGLICDSMGKEYTYGTYRATTNMGMYDNFFDETGFSMTSIDCPTDATSLSDCTAIHDGPCNGNIGIETNCLEPGTIDITSGWSLDDNSLLKWDGPIPGHDGYATNKDFNGKTAKYICDYLGKALVSWKRASIPTDATFSLGWINCNACAYQLSDCSWGTVEEMIDRWDWNPTADNGVRVECMELPPEETPKELLQDSLLKSPQEVPSEHPPQADCENLDTLQTCIAHPTCEWYSIHGLQGCIPYIPNTSGNNPSLAKTRSEKQSSSREWYSSRSVLVGGICGLMGAGMVYLAYCSKRARNDAEPSLSYDIMLENQRAI